MKAKAALFHKPEQPFELKEYELAAPREGYALIKMLASGVCGTDVHIHEGTLPVPLSPLVIGHEFTGSITEISEKDSRESGFKVGDRVIASVAEPCGECYLCKAGEPANCLNLHASYFFDPEKKPHLYGGFSEYTYASVKNMVRIPEKLPVKVAAIFACAGPTVIHSFKCAAGLDISKINTAVVQGLGPIGMFSVLYLKAHGVKNIVAVTTGKNHKRNEIAKTLGATLFIEISGSSLEERTKKVMEISEGIGADCVIEASGNPAAFNEGLAYLRNRGVYLVPGQYSNRGPIMIEPQIITFKALQIIGSSQYAMEDVDDYISFLSANESCWNSVSSVCTHEMHLDQINEAFDAAKKGNSVKVIFVNNEKQV